MSRPGFPSSLLAGRKMYMGTVFLPVSDSILFAIRLKSNVGYVFRFVFSGPFSCGRINKIAKDMCI
jgi:hypothetical protein